MPHGWQDSDHSIQESFQTKFGSKWVVQLLGHAPLKEHGGNAQMPATTE